MNIQSKEVILKMKQKRYTMEKSEIIWLWHIVFLVSLCLFCVPALADINIPLVPASRISYSAPDGLVITDTKTLGKIELLIDSRNSDWTKALLYTGSLQQVVLMIEVEPPVGATKVKMQGGDRPDEQMLTLLDAQGPWQAMSIAFEGIQRPLRYSQDVADYSISRSILTPWPSLSSLQVFLRWYDDADNDLGTEKLSSKVNFTDVRSFYAALPMIPQGDIIPNTGSLSDVSAETGRGEVVYTIHPLSLPLFDEWEDICTKVKAPPGAVECLYISMFEGSDVLEVHGGFVELGVSYIQNYDYLRTPRQMAFSLIWLDSNQNMIGHGSLSMRIQKDGQAEPWPSYVSGWNPVPAQRLHVEQSIQSSGVDVSYQQGKLQFQYNGSLPDVSQMDLAKARVKVTPPSGVQSYKLYASNRFSLGEQPQNLNDMNTNLTIQHEIVLTAGMDAGPIETDLFRKSQTEDGLTVYFSSDVGTLEHGMVYVFQWYQDDAATIPHSVEYYYLSIDEFVHIVEIPAVATEAQIPTNITEPILVGPSNWRLIIEHYPQVGNNARHYELHVKDEHDNIVILPGNTVVYLPYPPGFDFDSNTTYTLKHYDLEFENYGNVQIVPTEKGLRFVTASLSPFVISWAAGQPLPAGTPRPPVLPLPKTGDFFPTEVLIYAMIVMIGMATLVSFKKRKWNS